MRKNQIFGSILTLSLAFIISTACFSPALASAQYHNHANGGGAVIIDIANHQPPIKITVVHYDGGDQEVGDYLEISTWQYIVPLGRSVWATVALVTDSPSIAAFSKDFVFKGLPGVPVTIMLVKQCQLQVFRICNIVSAYWTTSIVSPSVTLPPGLLLFNGYGSVQTNHLVHILPNGVSITFDVVGYAAHASFVCRAWNYYGTVGDETTTMNIGLDSWISHT